MSQVMYVHPSESKILFCFLNVVMALFIFLRSLIIKFKVIKVSSFFCFSPLYAKAKNIKNHARLISSCCLLSHSFHLASHLLVPVACYLFERLPDGVCPKPREMCIVWFRSVVSVCRGIWLLVSFHQKLDWLHTL